MVTVTVIAQLFFYLTACSDVTAFTSQGTWGAPNSADKLSKLKISSETFGGYTFSGVFKTISSIINPFWSFLYAHYGDTETKKGIYENGEKQALWFVG